MIGLCDHRHRHREWLKFPRVIDAVTPGDKEIHPIADHNATHKHAKVRKWLGPAPEGPLPVPRRLTPAP